MTRHLMAEGDSKTGNHAPACRCLLALTALLTVFLPGTARADFDDRPGFGFTGDYLTSAAEAPCGVGTPPRGHFPPEIPAIGPFQALKLTVRQDANRLCYVFGHIAEAPVIRVRQGEDLLITLRNEITNPDALNAIIAPGTLDQPNHAIAAQSGFYPVIPAMHHPATGATNLHLHGFAVAPTVPQDEVMKTCVDPAVGSAACGRRQFTYHYRIPTTMPTGLYWYHPHVHGEVQAQMLLGLSGPIVVEGPADDARRGAGIDDRIFVVRQASDPDIPNQNPQTAPSPLPIKTPSPSRRPYADKAAGGRIDTADEMSCSDKAGIDELTLNGSKVLDGAVQDSDLAHLEIGAGKTQLWRVLNAATDAFLDLALVGEDGKPLPIGIIARDGAPLSDDAGRQLPPRSTPEAQLVPPAGRLEFLVQAPEPGRKIYLVTHAVDTGCAGDKVPERKLAYLTSVGTPTVATAPVPTITSPIPGPFNDLLARKTDNERTLAFAEYPHPGGEDLNDFYIAERKPGAVLTPYLMDGPPAITVKAGTTEEWVIENWTNELHAFHIHQLHFRVLEINGIKVPEPPLLDVVTVPAAGPGDISTAQSGVVPGRVRIKMNFPAELAGDIPFHCHLVDHEDSGMMGVLRVVTEAQALQQSVQHAGLSPTFDVLHPAICRAVATGVSRASFPVPTER